MTKAFEWQNAMEVVLAGVFREPLGSNGFYVVALIAGLTVFFFGRVILGALEKQSAGFFRTFFANLFFGFFGLLGAVLVQVYAGPLFKEEPQWLLFSSIAVGLLFLFLSVFLLGRSLLMSARRPAVIACLLTFAIAAGAIALGDAGYAAFSKGLENVEKTPDPLIE